VFDHLSNTGWDILYRSRIDSQNRGWHWWCGVDLEHRAVNSLGEGSVVVTCDGTSDSTPIQIG